MRTRAFRGFAAGLMLALTCGTYAVAAPLSAQASAVSAQPNVTIPSHVSASIAPHAASANQTLGRSVQTLDAPVVKARSAGFGRVSLAWSKVPGAEGYFIYRKAGSKAASRYLVTTLREGYVDTTAIAGDFNFYFVYAYVKDASGKLIKGKTPQYVYAKPDKVDPVTHLRADVIAGGRVQVAWSPVAGAAGYTVQINEPGRPVLGVPVDSTSLIDKWTLRNLDTSYTVQAYQYDERAQKHVGPARTVRPTRASLPPVTNLRAAATNLGVRLTWTGVNDVTHYAIYRKEGRSLMYLGAVSAGTTAFIDTRPNPGAYNFYFVYPAVKREDGKTYVSTSGPYTYAFAR